MSNATIKHNKEKNGIEIHFSGKPSPAVLDNIKNQSYPKWRWSRFNKCWYNSQITPATTAFAAQFGSVPASITDGGTPERIQEDRCNRQDALMVEAQETAMYERWG